jgi:hypothetical protein
MNEHIKVVGDVVSYGAVLAYITEYGPLLLAIPGAMYAVMRCIDWIENRRKNK